MTPKALRSLRLALGLSIAEFAQQLGVSAQELDDWECGLKRVDIEHLSRGLELLAPEESLAGHTPRHD